MNLHLSGGEDFPDVGNGEIPCCMGSAALDHTRCTCWVAEYSEPQREPKAGPMQIRERMCADCAFRPDSPERNGDERYAHSDEDGLEDAINGVFVCHVGLRLLVRHVHPNGAVFEAPPGAYEPPDPPCKADGSPAELCCGWATERRRREEAEHE